MRALRKTTRDWGDPVPFFFRSHSPQRHRGTEKYQGRRAVDAEVASGEALDGAALGEGEAEVGGGGLGAEEVVGTDLEEVSAPGLGKAAADAARGGEDGVSEEQAEGDDEAAGGEVSAVVQGAEEDREQDEERDHQQLRHPVARADALLGSGEAFGEEAVLAGGGGHGREL